MGNGGGGSASAADRASAAEAFREAAGAFGRRVSKARVSRTRTRTQVAKPTSAKGGER